MSTSSNQTDIIIPVYDLLDLTEQCVHSLFKYTEDYRLIVVDDGSGPETRNYLDSLEDVNGTVLLRNEKNIGYVKSINRALKTVSAPYVVWLSNDVIVTPHWLTCMLDTMKAHRQDRCGFVLPDSSYELHPWLRQLKLMLPNMDFKVETLIGGHLLMDTQVIDEIGFLDERFSGGYGCEEVDYWRRAQREGWTAWLSHKALVHHRAMSTFKLKYPDEWARMWFRNKMRLRLKWEAEDDVGADG